MNQVGVRSRTTYSSTYEHGSMGPAICFRLWLCFTCKERTQCITNWVILYTEMRNIPTITATQTKAVIVFIIVETRTEVHTAELD